MFFSFLIQTKIRKGPVDLLSQLNGFLTQKKHKIEKSKR